MTDNSTTNIQNNSTPNNDDIMSILKSGNINNDHTVNIIDSTTQISSQSSSDKNMTDDTYLLYKNMRQTLETKEKLLENKETMIKNRDKIIELLMMKSGISVNDIKNASTTVQKNNIHVHDNNNKTDSPKKINTLPEKCATKIKQEEKLRKIILDDRNNDDELKKYRVLLYDKQHVIEAEKNGALENIKRKPINPLIFKIAQKKHK